MSLFRNNIDYVEAVLFLFPMQGKLSDVALDVMCVRINRTGLHQDCFIPLIYVIRFKD